MRIHITTTAPEQAAREIMQHMEARGGEWIVNAVEDEGYVIAKVGTLDGRRLSRSLSPSLCGPFSAAWTVDAMTNDLRAARRISLGVKANCDKYDLPKEDQQERVSPTQAAIDMLKRGTVTIADLRAELNLSKAGAHSVMARLVESNRAKIISRVPRPRGGGAICTYGAAA